MVGYLSLINQNDLKKFLSIKHLKIAHFVWTKGCQGLIYAQKILFQPKIKFEQLFNENFKVSVAEFSQIGQCFPV